MQGFVKLYEKFPIDPLFSLSVKFSSEQKTFLPINSLNKILRNSEGEIRFLKDIPSNPLDKKIPELLIKAMSSNTLDKKIPDLIKGENEKDNPSAQLIFSQYNKEVFEFPRKIGDGNEEEKNIKSKTIKNYLGQNKEDNNSIQKVVYNNVNSEQEEEVKVQQLSFNLFTVKVLYICKFLF